MPPPRLRSQRSPSGIVRVGNQDEPHAVVEHCAQLVQVGLPVTLLDESERTHDPAEILDEPWDLHVVRHLDGDGRTGLHQLPAGGHVCLGASDGDDDLIGIDAIVQGGDPGSQQVRAVGLPIPELKVAEPLQPGELE